MDIVLPSLYGVSLTNVKLSSLTYGDAGELRAHRGVLILPYDYVTQITPAIVKQEYDLVLLDKWPIIWAYVEDNTSSNLMTWETYREGALSLSRAFKINTLTQQGAPMFGGNFKGKLITSEWNASDIKGRLMQ